MKKIKTKMFLSVLTKNLNWESLTKNLVNFNFIMGFTEKSDFFREGWAVFRIKGEGGWKKRAGVLSPSFWKVEHAIMTLPNQLNPKQI